MTTRSSVAPDLPGASSSPARSVAFLSRPASSSGTGRLHLGEQRGRPAAAAEDHVGHDTVIAHRQHVQVVPGVRHAVLGPAERVLDHLGRSALDGVAAQFVEASWVGEPSRVLGADRVGAVRVQPPVGHGRVERRVRAPRVAAFDVRGLDRVQELVDTGLGYLAAADAARLPAAVQAECLRELEQHDAMATAARAGFLAAFTAGQGPAGDGDYSAVSWLMHRTGITKGAAVGHTAWARRAATHPRVIAALAAGQVPESAGRVICLWTGKLPLEHRDAADEQLLAAFAGGL